MLRMTGGLKVSMIPAAAKRAGRAVASAQTGN